MHHFRHKEQRLTDQGFWQLGFDTRLVFTRGTIAMKTTQRGCGLLLLLVPWAAAFQPTGLRPWHAGRAPSTRLNFKIPADEVPIVKTLDPKANFTLSGAEPLQDKDVFRMPWLAPVAAPRRGWMEKAIMATPEEEVGGDPQDAAEAVEAKKELAELELLERQLGLGEEGPVLFVSRLGSAESAASNVSWLQQPSAHVLEVPAEENRALKYRAPGWPSTLNAGVRRRISPFPLFAKAVPQGCVVVASIKGEDLALLTDDGPPSLGKLFQEPPIGWLEPVGPLIKAAHDPRVKALILKIGPLSCGYAKIVELRRAMDYFKASGKQLIAYMDSAAEKEYYLALGCDEVWGEGGWGVCWLFH